MTTLASAVQVEPDKYAVDLADNGWHLASALWDRRPILVNADATEVYDFRESLLGTAIKPYAAI